MPDDGRVVNPTAEQDAAIAAELEQAARAKTRCERLRFTPAIKRPDTSQAAQLRLAKQILRQTLQSRSAALERQQRLPADLAAARHMVVALEQLSQTIEVKISSYTSQIDSLRKTIDVKEQAIARDIERSILQRKLDVLQVELRRLS